VLTPIGGRDPQGTGFFFFHRLEHTISLYQFTLENSIDKNIPVENRMFSE